MSFFGLLYRWMLDAYHYFFELVTINLCWLLLSIPLVTAAPAAAGLYYATNQLAHDEHEVTWRTFFTGFRQHFWLSWRWGALNLLVIAVLLSNIWFYQRFTGAWVPWVETLFISLIFLWWLLQIYTFPLLLEQQNTSLRVALRNSLVFYLRQIRLALGMALLIMALIYLSIRFVPPAWGVLTISLCAYLANRMTILLIAEINTQLPPRRPDDVSTQA